MKTRRFSRRDFVKSTAIVAAAVKLTSTLRAAGEASASATVPAAKPAPTPVGDGAALHWLEGKAPATTAGATWGVPWPRGRFAKDATFALRTAGGEAVPVQSWPTAYWPDGSLKWTAHTIGADAGREDTLILAPGTPAAPAQGVTVRETADAVDIDTGVIRCLVAKQGAALIQSIVRDGRVIAQDGRLVALLQDQPELSADGALRQEAFSAPSRRVTVEQRGPVRAVVKLEGKHASAAGRAWLPFVVRLYFHGGAEAVRMMHSFVFDGDENKDFIRGLGVRFACR
jgi:hypothetical protein